MKDNKEINTSRRDLLKRASQPLPLLVLLLREPRKWPLLQKRLSLLKRREEERVS